MSAVYFDASLFADRVMDRVAGERPPTSAGTISAALRNRDANLAVGAVWTAWHLATVRNTVVGRRVRLHSAALLVLLALLLATGSTLAAAGAAVVVRTASEHFLPNSVFQSGLTVSPSPSAGAQEFPVVVTPTDDLERPPSHSPGVARETPGSHPPDPTPTVRDTPPGDGGGHVGPSPRPDDGSTNPGNGHPPGEGGDDVTPPPGGGDGSNPGHHGGGHWEPSPTPPSGDEGEGNPPGDDEGHASPTPPDDEETDAPPPSDDGGGDGDPGDGD